MRTFECKGCSHRAYSNGNPPAKCEKCNHTRFRQLPASSGIPAAVKSLENIRDQIIALKVILRGQKHPHRARILGQLRSMAETANRSIRLITDTDAPNIPGESRELSVDGDDGDAS